MKKTSYILFLCLCVTIAFARDESSTNGAANANRAMAIVSTQPAPNQQGGLFHVVQDDHELLAAFVFAGTPPASCTDSIADCKNPVKYLGSDVGCACFACEYGKATQHNVCTNVKADKEALLKRSTHTHSPAASRQSNSSTN